MEMNPNQQNLIAGFYVSNRERLISFAAARLPFPEESEDVVQDTFLRLLEYGRMVQEETLSSLVYTILRNIINDRLRRFRCHCEVNTWLHETETLSGNYTERKVEEHTLLHIVETKIKRLPPACGKVYSLHLFDGLTADELARQLSVSKRTIECYLFQARKKVRKEVLELWYKAV